MKVIIQHRRNEYFCVFSKISVTILLNYLILKRFFDEYLKNKLHYMIASKVKNCHIAVKKTMTQKDYNYPLNSYINVIF